MESRLRRFAKEERARGRIAWPNGVLSNGVGEDPVPVPLVFAQLEGLREQ